MPGGRCASTASATLCGMRNADSPALDYCPPVIALSPIPLLDMGSLILNAAPPWTRFLADIAPWCASIMVRAMDNPMPMPSALLVKNGSKTSFNFSSGMPEPRAFMAFDGNSQTVEFIKPNVFHCPGLSIS